MRFRIILVLVAVFFCGWMTGCSSEEPSGNKGNEPKAIRRPIKRPAKKVQAPAPKQKRRPKPASPRPEVTAEAEAAGPEKEGSQAGVKAEAAPVVQAGIEAGHKAAAAEGPPKPAEPSKPPAQEKGVYTVAEGDSLAVIAGREEVFGDPLKWPILYQLNRERLEGVVLDERLPERTLPMGKRLRYALDEKAAAKAAGNTYWVVNVISSPTADKIDGPAVRLIEKGFPVYISRATVKGQKWMRLRVGFFKSRGAALEAGKELQQVLGQEDSWPVRIGPEETAEYAVYLD